MEILILHRERGEVKPHIYKHRNVYIGCDESDDIHKRMNVCMCRDMITMFQDGPTKEARFTYGVCEVVPFSNQVLPLDAVRLFLVVGVERWL